jgi:hypothetical protein
MYSFVSPTIDRRENSWPLKHFHEVECGGVVRTTTENNRGTGMCIRRVFKKRDIHESYIVLTRRGHANGGVVKSSYVLRGTINPAYV